MHDILEIIKLMFRDFGRKIKTFFSSLLKEVKQRRLSLHAKAFIGIALFTAVVWIFVSSNETSELPVKADERNVTIKLPESGYVDTSSEYPADNIDIDDWRLVLVNEQNPFKNEYTPELAHVENGWEFDERAAEQLKNMLKDARAEGLKPFICSAYRSISFQEKLFDTKISQLKKSGYSSQEAYEIAKTSVNPPGVSEHHLGLAVDIVATYRQTLDSGFESTPEAVWLAENAPKYGFILRYLKGKKDVTGIIFEPWHFRYVGTEYSYTITESGLCFEEWIESVSGENDYMFSQIL